MSKTNKPIMTSEDDRVVWGTLISVAAGLLVWTCILVYDIKQDVKHIKKTLNDIEETLTPIEQINDPAGLIQHMGSFRPLQKEYPEANFLDGSTVSDEPLPIIVETDISSQGSSVLKGLGQFSTDAD